MEFISKSQSFSRKDSCNEKKSSIAFKKPKSIIIRAGELNNDTSPINTFTYRTEFYLQQREKQNVNKPPSTTITTWKNLKYQRQIFDNDQSEIDRVLSTIDSIHGAFNRSLLIPYNQAYSLLYENNDKSDRLMKTFCERQDHCMSYDLSMKDHGHLDNNTLETLSSFRNFQDTTFDDNTEDEEENENEKKKTYDSGYGSFMPMRQFSRESLIKITQSVTTS